MNNRIIVHVEDNYHNRRIVRKILLTQGYQIYEAEDGLGGLQMIKDVVPDLVLLDISLPGIDGLEIVGRLKASEAYQNIPVIALTASAMVGDRERFLAAGCDDYLSKPVRALTLIQRVNSYFT
ncbi:MAG TPA: response regulator [Thermoflexia bacterium]|nr:response regulator [Thermoflexia bacterium]